MSRRQRVRESLAQVEQGVQTLQSQRNDLLAQLQATDANLTRMNDERASLVESMVVTEADMPDEVLRMIFAEARTLSTPPNPTILLASHVSRRWNRVAVNDRSLWTNVHITTRERDAVRNVLIYLRRSGDLPIKVTLDLHKRSTVNQFTQFVLGLLIQNVQRWLCFSVKTQNQEPMMMVLSRLQNIAAPRLERFDLEVGENLARSPITFPLFTGGTPLLSSVRMSGIYFTSPLVPSSAVTHLDIGIIPSGRGGIVPELRHITSASPSLASLTISHSQVNLAPFSIPALKSLVVSGFQYYMTDRVCSSIHAPSLESLTLHDSVYVTISDIVKTVRDEATGQPRYPQLRSLDLSAVPVRCLTEAFMESTSTITSLSLHSADANAFLSMIKAQSENIGNPQNAVANDWIPLWRHLHTLTLTRGQFDEMLLRDMLYARLVIHRPIRKLHIRPADYQDTRFRVYRFPPGYSIL
ncbi:hypothetical protein PILCRDRAFT_815953 [Piloderma croceum F 1598]|uniref:F-box domain-containing protein n=1 Tax=Piloderma croceum (strain F 1598) TaxID=765440 RepID=A0A0C3FRX2_PILCF|nr:hypothetical protein PILCRDRAFT_815953 [Piloderma croceum F 1598]